VISTANLSIQFGAKPLFENVSVTFGNGNRYGLIGANGSGKSTFMKIMAGELEPTAGNVSADPNARIGQLRQDQFAYEDFRVLDTVIMGHEQLWPVLQERDRLYSLPEMSDAEGMRVADLEIQFAEMDGYTAESRAGELLENIGIPVEQHEGPMSAIAPGWKLRVLLAQALFSDPDILLLDEPTNNLDINTIRWLEGFLTDSKSTMVIISHDRTRRRVQRKPNYRPSSAGSLPTRRRLVRPHRERVNWRRSSSRTSNRPAGSALLYASSRTSHCDALPSR